MFLKATVQLLLSKELYTCIQNRENLSLNVLGPHISQKLSKAKKEGGKIKKKRQGKKKKDDKKKNRTPVYQKSN